MLHGITGIDHLVIAVEDLEDARATWGRLGFTLTPRGRHRDMATGNYCIMFPSDYVELMGIIDPGLPDRGLRERMTRNGEGLDRVAFAVRDADETAGALQASGYDIKGPVDLRRPLELPEGEVEPRFRLILLPEGAAPAVNGFICHHDTPEIVRTPEWLQHPNGVLSIASLVAVAENPASLAEAWQKLLGPGCTVLTDDTLTVHAGDAAIIFVTPDHLSLMYPALAEEEFPPPPRMVAATFRVADTAATARVLDDNGMPYRLDPDGAIQTGPADTNGLLVAFES